MEQMTELFKAMDAKLKEIKEDIKTNHKEMLAKVETNQVRMMAKMDSQLMKMEACQGKAGTTNLEANPEEIRVRGGAWEVPKEEAQWKLSEH
jgi:HSP90 family molecular chaperone